MTCYFSLSVASRSFDMNRTGDTEKEETKSTRTKGRFSCTGTGACSLKENGDPAPHTPVRDCNPVSRASVSASTRVLLRVSDLVLRQAGSSSPAHHHASSELCLSLQKALSNCLSGPTQSHVTGSSSRLTHSDPFSPHVPQLRRTCYQRMPRRFNHQLPGSKTESLGCFMIQKCGVYIF